MSRRLHPVAAALAGLIAALGGCATLPHTELPLAPDASAPYEQRAAYYRAHAPELVTFSETGYLLLHGGTRLYFPEDLRPAVDPDSPTAQAIEQHVPARETARAINDWVGMPALAVATLGGIGASVAFPLALNATDGDFGRTFTDPLLLASGGVFVLGLGGIVAAGLLASEPSRIAGESLVTLLRTYPQSLEDRLAIHVDGDGNLVDTAAPAAAPAERAVPAADAVQHM